MWSVISIAEVTKLKKKCVQHTLQISHKIPLIIIAGDTPPDTSFLHKIPRHYFDCAATSAFLFPFFSTQIMVVFPFSLFILSRVPPLLVLVFCVLRSIYYFLTALNCSLIHRYVNIPILRANHHSTDWDIRVHTDMNAYTGNNTAIVNFF